MSLLTLLVQNETGYRNLMRLVSRAHLEFKTGSLSALPLAELEGNTEGLLALVGYAGSALGRLLLAGDAAFEDDHTVRIAGSDDPIRAARIVIATGTRPARPATVEFDDRTIIDSDGLLKLESRVPRTMTVVGAGVIGVEYASMFGALGTKVTVVDQRDRVLSFLDTEIGEAFQYLLRRRNVTFRLREKVDAVEALKGRGARLKLASGKDAEVTTLRAPYGPDALGVSPVPGAMRSLRTLAPRK